MLRELFLQYKRKWWFWAGLFVFIILCLAVSAFKGRNAAVSYIDFSGFYTAGYHFSEGKELYGKIYKHVMPFYYLPFMAMIFSTLSLIYYQYSAFIFYSFNILLTPLIYIYILRILELCGYTWKEIKWPFVLSLILSLRYIGTNYDLGQVNVFVFIFILLGFIHFLKNNDNKSLIFFSIAAIIKIIPAVFIFWYFLKKPSWKVIYIPLLVLTLAILLPFPFRGIELSFYDLQSFYNHVLQEHLFSAEVFYRYTNQSLSAFLGRIFFPPAGENQHIFPYLNLSQLTGNTIILVTRLILLLSFIFLTLRLRKIPKQFMIFEFAIVILFIHLFSSLTWKNHLVTLVLVFIPFFMMNFNNKKPFARFLLAFVCLILILLSLSFATLIGYQFSNYIGSYSLYFIMMLFFYVYYYRFSLKSILIKQKDIDIY